MTLKKTIILMMVILATGCAGMPVRPEQLQITIEPRQLSPGAVVTVTVISPVALKTASGRLDLPGMPLIPLKSLDAKTWIWRTQIPLEASWRPGRYRIVVQGLTTTGETLFGETWITAP